MAHFSFDGIDIYYEVHGDRGVPLVILNGIMMSTASWNSFVPNFSENNIVILVDFVDQGKSQKMNRAYDHSLQVRVVEELVDMLGYDKVVVMGISYGGEVGLQYALKRPDRVKRLILANTAARTSKWVREVGHNWNAVAATGDGYQYYLTTIPIIYSDEYQERRRDWMDAREKMLVEYFSDKTVLARMVRLTDSSENYDVSKRLNEIKCPTLIISGSKDGLTPIPEQRLLHKGIKNSRWVVMNGSGHATMYEEPDTFTALVVGFANILDEEIVV